MLTGVSNSPLINEPGQNTDSCKLLAFARLHDLTEGQTLACIGAYYRADVLKNPDGNSHPNIRQFLKTGRAGVEFDAAPPRARTGVRWVFVQAALSQALLF